MSQPFNWIKRWAREIERWPFTCKIKSDCVVVIFEKALEPVGKDAMHQIMLGTRRQLTRQADKLFKKAK